MKILSFLNLRRKDDLSQRPDTRRARRTAGRERRDTHRARAHHLSHTPEAEAASYGSYGLLNVSKEIRYA